MLASAPNSCIPVIYCDLPFLHLSINSLPTLFLSFPSGFTPLICFLISSISFFYLLFPFFSPSPLCAYPSCSSQLYFLSFSPSSSFGSLFLYPLKGSCPWGVSLSTVCVKAKRTFSSWEQPHTDSATSCFMLWTCQKITWLSQCRTFEKPWETFSTFSCYVSGHEQLKVTGTFLWRKSEFVKSAAFYSIYAPELFCVINGGRKFITEE